MFLKILALKNFVNFSAKRLCCRPAGLQIYQKDTPTQYMISESVRPFSFRMAFTASWTLTSTESILKIAFCNVFTLSL